MGSLRVLALVGALMGCEASGLRIDVVLPEGGPAPDHIRLFVGVPAENDQAMIGPAGFNRTRTGASWVRDPLDFEDIIEVTPGAELSFGFLSDVDHAELGAIIAVGYTGTTPTSAGSLFHIKTGVDVVRIFKLRLFPAVDAREEMNRGAPVQIEIWGADDGEEACVHLWNKHPDRDMTDPHDSAFIVSKDNRDCDRWMDDDVLECSADIHEASSPPMAAGLDCARFDDRPDEAFCVLGGPSCVDGVMPDGQCTPSKYCAPGALCNLCMQLPDATARRNCIRAPYAVPNQPQSLFGVKCHIGTIEESVGAPTRMLCPYAPTLLVGNGSTPFACSNAMVARVGQTFGNAITHDGAQLAVAVDAACTLTLTPTGAVGGPFSTTPIVYGIVTVDLDNGRSLALPLQVHIDPPFDSCTGANYCQLFGDPQDAPISCLLAASPPL